MGEKPWLPEAQLKDVYQSKNQKKQASYDLHTEVRVFCLFGQGKEKNCYYQSLAVQVYVTLLKKQTPRGLVNTE